MLVDAQELVARQMGLDGWQEPGADAMTDEPRQTAPGLILSSISVQLFVANIKSSCDSMKTAHERTPNEPVVEGRSR
jgi:hypothetical protein